MGTIKDKKLWYHVIIFLMSLVILYLVADKFFTKYDDTYPLLNHIEEIERDNHNLEVKSNNLENQLNICRGEK